MEHEKVRELALLMFDSGHLTLPEHESLLAEWFEQNPPQPKDIADRTAITKATGE
tara:strand:- start:1667 stop:1831 length:165 start_codon:yes stop_codon:yes gene_type:complete